MATFTQDMTPDLRARITAAIYGNILDGADVMEAVHRAAEDARRQAMSEGWAPVLATFLGTTVATVGAELVADMVRNLAAAR
ncbi:hypothetical protein AB0B57_22425 [Micromonospora sp. NPDC049101]|uniref:hypothetical protein n=1 Tax=Micromonospora sp. NPDC049101 TaxID=3155032 RepID=UPI0033F28594